MTTPFRYALAAFLLGLFLFLSAGCETLESWTGSLFGSRPVILELENAEQVAAPMETRKDAAKILQDRLDHTSHVEGNVTINEHGQLVVKDPSYSRSQRNHFLRLLQEPELVQFYLEAGDEQYALYRPPEPEVIVEDGEEQEQDPGEPELQPEETPAGYTWASITDSNAGGPGHEEHPGRLLIHEEPFLLGQDVEKSTAYSPDEAEGNWWIRLEFRGEHSETLKEITENNPDHHIVIFWGDQTLAAAKITQTVTDGVVRIEGAFTESSARQIATLINLPPLPARLRIVEQ